MTTTPYDTVAYPSTVHKSTHPERLAIAARLAGIDPAPMDGARVLEIGGGTCLGLIAFAAAYPGSQCHGFDLSAQAIAHGRRLAGEACPNVTLDVVDILAARDHYAAGSFDYVIAHGVYAWVPEPVRRALLDLIAHVLSPCGVAFVSYNAMPGGHVRLILRDMLLHAIAGIDDPAERVSAAFAALRAYAAPRDDDEPLVAGLRSHAARMALRPASVLFHDELGDCYAPQSLTQVVDAGRAAGLRFLTDAGTNRGFDGFLPHDPGAHDDAHTDADADPDAEVVQLAQMRDYLEMCWFRATLFVRAEAPVVRRLDPARIDGLWVSAELKLLESGEFQSGDDIFSVADAPMAQALTDLAMVWPARRPVRALAQGDAQIQTLLGLYQSWFVTLHLAPAPFAPVVGERPATGGWIRAMLRAGETDVVTLSHRNMRIEQPDLRGLMMAADGTQTIAALAQSQNLAPDYVAAAMAEMGRRALMVR